MFDAHLKRKINPVLDRIGAALASAGISANMMTTAGLVLGVAATGAIAAHWYLTGLALIAISRFADGLDGAVARHSKPTDFGGFLDIVYDFFFYALIPLGFAFADPEANGLAAAVLLATFYANGATFLAYAIIAEKRGLLDSDHKHKSIVFTTGLTEATETFAVFTVFCLFPQSFPVVAYLFAAACLYTAISRVVFARRTFTEPWGE